MSISPDRNARSGWWRVLRSLWLIVPVVSFGCLGGAALLYVGLRLRRRSAWIAGIVYTVVGVPAFWIIGTAPVDSMISDVTVPVVLAVWFAQVVHACLLNGAWLDHLAGPPSPAAAPLPLGWTPSGPVGSTPPFLPSITDYYGRGAAASAAGTAPSTPSVVDGNIVDSIDVNTAPAWRLAGLPGFDEVRAAAVVAEREARSGFADVLEFAGVAGLAPHELARLRPTLTCSARVQPAWQPTDPPRGRVLDV